MLIVLYVLGVFATAIYVTNDPNWSRWHISYLGEHPGLGADIFNYGVMFGGVIMVWFSFRMHAYLMGENQRRVDVPRIRATGVSLILLLIAIGVYGVGMFPLQYGNLPHDIFGYSMGAETVLHALGEMQAAGEAESFAKFYEVLQRDSTRPKHQIEKITRTCLPP